MRIGLGQINSVLGDFTHNREQILKNSQLAAKKGCELLVFPELALFGYNPMDLPERASIVQNQIKELHHLHRQIPAGIGVLVGAITINANRFGKLYYNSAVYLE